jgi:hypothetical protein
VIARDGNHDLAVAVRAVEGRPHRVHVILVDVADDVIHGDPLLVLDVPERDTVLVVRVIERFTAVCLGPVPAEIV